MSTGSVTAAAERLIEVERAKIPCNPVVDLIGTTDIGLAYEVQKLVTEHKLRAGASRVGRKIGLTSESVQKQIGVNRPDFGVLFEDMAFIDGDLIPMDRLLQPKAEAEIAFLLGSDILPGFTSETLRASVAYAVAALEIVDSRVRDWNIAITDTVADNASSGLFVLASKRLTLDMFDPATVQMRMLRNSTLVSEGDGSACLGDPLTALEWLAHTAIENDDPLRRGDIVLSGALGPMVDVRPGDMITAELGALGTVTARFGKTK